MGVNSGVGVSVSVGVDVGMGVIVGVSGVKVRVGSWIVGDKTANKADWVNPAITVCAAAVLMAFESCIEIAGKIQARVSIAKPIMVNETRRDIITPYTSSGPENSRRASTVHIPRNFNTSSSKVSLF